MRPGSFRDRDPWYDLAASPRTHNGAAAYAAVTYRSVAARAEVTAGLVQYYFPSIDDLFIALLRADTDRIIERFARAARDDRPLRALWEYASSKPGTTLMLEFMALANHRKAIG